jgi:hypothetical protein
MLHLLIFFRCSSIHFWYSFDFHWCSLICHWFVHLWSLVSYRFSLMFIICVQHFKFFPHFKASLMLHLCFTYWFSSYVHRLLFCSSVSFDCPMFFIDLSLMFYRFSLMFMDLFRTLGFSRTSGFTYASLMLHSCFTYVSFMLHLCFTYASLIDFL